MMRRRRRWTLILTDREWRALREAVRFLQQTIEETSDRLDPTLSRIQRKMGDEPHGT